MGGQDRQVLDKDEFDAKDHESGDIELEGKSDTEVQKAVRSYVEKLIAYLASSKCDIGVIIDYRIHILREARRYAQKKDYEFAILFYGTYFEHWLNDLIEYICRKQKLDRDLTQKAIRSLQIEAKITWFPKLFGYKIHKPHANAVLEIMGQRNAFVHYKWKGESPDDWPKKEEETKELIMKAENAIKYLQMFKNKYLYKSQKKRIKRIFPYK